jgi:Na+-translocating ferredoxin:NAD+ oxidoreductase RnfG subunit
VRAVQDARGATLGWFFRSDQVAPAVRGKRGEIGVLVGISTNGTILGVQVAAHREDAKWFDRIRAPFYAAFTGCSVHGEGKRPDAVTGATVSSAAMIKDVFSSSRTVLALPAVKRHLTAAAREKIPTPHPPAAR